MDFDKEKNNNLITTRNLSKISNENDTFFTVGNEDNLIKTLLNKINQKDFKNKSLSKKKLSNIHNLKDDYEFKLKVLNNEILTLKNQNEILSKKNNDLIEEIKNYKNIIKNEKINNEIKIKNFNSEKEILNKKIKNLQLFYDNKIDYYEKNFNSKNILLNYEKKISELLNEYENIKNLFENYKNNKENYIKQLNEKNEKKYNNILNINQKYINKIEELTKEYSILTKEYKHLFKLLNQFYSNNINKNEILI